VLFSLDLEIVMAFWPHHATRLDRCRARISSFPAVVGETLESCREPSCFPPGCLRARRPLPAASGRVPGSSIQQMFFSSWALNSETRNQFTRHRTPLPAF
jgi:hypothetical protein